MEQQSHHVGLDVSLETTSICVIDDAGAAIWRGKCSSDPDSLTAIVRQHAPGAVRVGLETGQLSGWLTLSLRRRGLPVVCMDARHAKAALSLQINKTDANDAFDLAQVVRTGWYREVAVKSMDAHTLRMLLVARSHLVSQRQATANTIPGLLKTFGLAVARGSKGLFSVRVREQIAGNPALIAIIEPLLAVWYAIREQVTMLDRQILARARNDQVARRLMTIPGVGVVTALAYTAVIDDPARTLNYGGGPLGVGAAGHTHDGDRLPWVPLDGKDNYEPLAMTWQVHVYGSASAELVAWCASHSVPLHVFGWRSQHEVAGLACDAIRPDTYVAFADPSGAPDALGRYWAEHGIRSLTAS